MTNLLNSTENIIFDLDGTLWDPMGMSIKAWHTALEGATYIKNPISEEDIRGILGMQHNLVGQKLFPYLPKGQQEQVMDSCYKAEVQGIKEFGAILYPGLEDTLRSLNGKYGLYIVSNCQAGYIEAFYEFHSLGHYFKDFECSGNTGKSKADNIAMLMKRNNLGNSLYIGDTQGDYLAAEANAIPFIFAEYGFGTVPDARFTIKKIEDLKRFG
ncbi:MAG TPA: HAD family hydrolase [Arenibacter sp.]|nr:HAD family hydrolase [Arenibacter sp.]